MRTIKLLLCLASAIMCLSAADRPGHMAGLYMSFPNHVHVNIEQVAEPPVSWSLPTGMYTNGTTLHRVIQDLSKKMYFGYDLTTEPRADGKIEVRIEPLSMSADELDKALGNHMESFVGLRFMVLPKYPEPQIIEPGDTIALDLLSSPGGKQKVVDYLDFSLDSKKK